MNTTTHLARHMLGFEPNKDAARLCLYHYLIHHCDPDTPLTPKLFENFCRMALIHEHWQINCMSLSQELQYIIQHYNETFMLNWNLKDFVFPDHWQVVTIKNSIEGIYILEKWASQNLQAVGQTKVFYTRDKNYIVLARDASDNISVIHASPLMLIQRGELQPLTMAIRLEYDSQLELKPDQSHYVKIDSHTYARFRINKKNISGMSIRGYIFQNHQKFQGKLNEYPSLYYPLKRMEQYYVERKSDPDYQELVAVLEKGLELLNLGHPEAAQFGEAALERGQSALDNIFINDNVIQTLVDQLKQEIS